jgi:hypothetical protein
VLELDPQTLTFARSSALFLSPAEVRRHVPEDAAIGFDLPAVLNLQRLARLVGL